MNKYLVLIAQMFVTLSLFSCSSNIKEVSRVVNESSAIDAVIANRETDATVATPTEIYITQKDGRAKGEPVFRADNVEGLKLEWRGSEDLKVHAEKARVFLQSTSVKVDSASKKSHIIHIQFDIKNSI